MSVLDYMKRLRDQANPFDHGKTAANATGLPLHLPKQNPGLDTQGGPTLTYYQKPVNMPTVKPYTSSEIKKTEPVFGIDRLLKGFDYPEERNWMGNMKPKPMIPLALRQSTMIPYTYPKGDYEIPVVGSKQPSAKFVPAKIGPKKQVRISI